MKVADLMEQIDADMDGVRQKFHIASRDMTTRLWTRGSMAWIRGHVLSFTVPTPTAPPPRHLIDPPPPSHHYPTTRP